MATGLEGRLEQVRIVGLNSAKEAAGFVHAPGFNKKVIVRHAEPYIGKVCLVQFNLKNSSEDSPPFASFITESIPLDFKRGLSSKEYFLYGLWRENWKYDGEFPQIDEIRRHFGSEDMGSLMYCRKDSDDENGRYILRDGSSQKIEKSYRKIVEDRLCQIPKGRVIILESTDAVFSVLKQAKRKGLVAVQMQPISED
jgi:hypothetical protein